MAIMSAIREVLKLKGGPSTFNGMGIRRVFCQVMKSGYPANTVSERTIRAKQV